MVGNIVNLAAPEKSRSAADIGRILIQRSDELGHIFSVSELEDGSLCLLFTDNIDMASVVYLCERAKSWVLHPELFKTTVYGRK